MERIGFIGLGIMGFPMASHLLKAGYLLTVYNRTIEKAKKLEEMGARIAHSPREVSEESDIVFAMVSNSEAIEEIVFGENGIIEGAREGLIFINCSTVSPKTNIELSKKLKEYGIEVLDAPVTGSGVQARAGKLTFMVGGKREIYERCLPLFLTMGKEAYHVGDIGAGSYTKLANNTMLAINMMSLAEGLILAAKAGIDPEIFLKIVCGGGAKSSIAEAKIPKIVSRDFTPDFKESLMLKDVGLALDQADEFNITLPILSLCREILKIADIEGYGDEDLCAMIKCYEEWARVKVGK